MLNHPYSFDTNEQMAKYMGTLADDLATDGCFTNRSDLSLRYLIDNGFRCNANIPHPFHPGQTYDNSQAPATVPDPIQTLQRLGY
jgi:glycerophosphoryl diester phosphodiesterase